MRPIFCILLLVLASCVVKLSLDAATLSDAAARRLDLSSSTELAWKSVLERFSFKLYRGASDEKETLAIYYGEAKRKEGQAKYFAYLFLAAAGLFLGLRLVVSKYKKTSIRLDLAMDVLCISLMAFAVGIIAPIMALKAYATVPVLGTVILNYESKSVVSALVTLASSGNWFIAVLIGMLSVILPIMKTAVSVISLQSKKPAWANRTTKIIKAIGKWSMADVFVIAIFIAYFAIGQDDFSDATAGLGLYFFSAYCLLSQVVTHYLLTSPTLSNEQLVPTESDNSRA